jgi:hypothetical protein
MDEIPNDAVEKADENDGKKKQKTVARRVLSARQGAAVRELLRGRGVASAARTIGVSRQTLYRWMAEPRFMACMNKWRLGVTEVARGQVFAALGDAADTVAKALREGDLRASLVVMKEMGALRPATADSEDGEVIARRQQIRRRADQVALDRADVELAEAEAMTDALRQMHAPPRPPASAPAEPTEESAEPASANPPETAAPGKKAQTPSNRSVVDFMVAMGQLKNPVLIRAYKEVEADAIAHAVAAARAAPPTPASPAADGATPQPARPPADPPPPSRMPQASASRPSNHHFSSGPEPVDELEDQFVDIAGEEFFHRPK